MTFHGRQATSLVSICTLGAIVMLVVSIAMAQDNVIVPPTGDAPPATGQDDFFDEQPPNGEQATPAPAPADAEDQETFPEASVVTGSEPNKFLVNFQNTDLRLALRILSTQGKKNIVAGKDITGSVTATFYDVTFEEALTAILKMNGYVHRQQDNFIYVYTLEQLAAETEATEPLVIQLFRLSYITATDAEILIGPALSDFGEVALTPAADVGVGADIAFAGGNSYAAEDVLVVRDYQANIDIVAELLNELDIRPDQVLIEATILSAKLDETNALGVNFSMLAGIDFESLGSVSTGVGNMTAGGILSEDMQGLRAANFSTGFNTVGGGFNIGFISNNVSVFITALERITDLTVLANPKLLVVNKQRGEVVVGSRDGYRTTVVNQGISTEKIEFLETGTRLFVRPFIGKDGYIRLEIHPEDSDGTIIQGLPSETTTEITTNVLIRDGHTIVLGGLFREEAQESRSQVPILGNIPGIGLLFRNTEDKIERREIIVLITPHIIRQGADEGVSEQIMDDVERFRIGQRKGLRWWGRSRLAATYVNWASQAYLRGDQTMAAWHVDMALSMDPRLLAAIRLKEELTQKAYWADAVRVSSVKHVIQRMIMQDLGRSYDEVISPDKPLGAEQLDERVIDALGIIPLVDKYRPAAGRENDANQDPND